MKRMMKALMLFALVGFAVLFNGSPAIATSLQTAQKIHVIHPEEGRVLALGQDLMTFKNTINPENPRDISLMVVTHPPQQGGLVTYKSTRIFLRKRRLQPDANTTLTT